MIDGEADPGGASERVRRYFDAHAAGYDRQMSGAERHLLGHHRRWAASRADGDVLELAVGTGLNLPLYGAGARRVLGIDLSEEMLARASARIAEEHLGNHVQVRPGDAQALDLPDDCMDTVVATYALCAVPDPGAALAQARRVLRPGGHLVLVDHGVARPRWARLLQRALNPATTRWQSENLLLRPLELVTAAGFEVVEADQVGRAGLVHRTRARRPPGR